MDITGKKLADLHMEIELGLAVYPSTNHDVWVWREEANPYHEFSIYRQGEHPWYMAYDANRQHGYSSFEELLNNWSHLALQPIWSTIKTPEREAYEQSVTLNTCENCGKPYKQIAGDNDDHDWCEGCAEAINQMCWDASTAKKELMWQYKDDVAMLKKLIIERTATYIDHYPQWNYADALAKELAALDWEEEIHKHKKPQQP